MDRAGDIGARDGGAADWGRVVTRRIPAPPPPVCCHEGCDNPAMAQCPECFLHWMLTRGWNEATGAYEEALPFAEPVGDPDYAGAEMYVAQTATQHAV